ncbi:PREDICTED: cuticle protein-like [Nicrophorus vespilloides]|uniref:Cuticle protein-like n=1 Tax=Nicrophorus vespilloides TaxID=110193 RepID=A0ABM1MAZ4_NICVS|nr:PREDICTED: cuticle protein-like [Nicrophorus vespilloides]
MAFKLVVLCAALAVASAGNLGYSYGAAPLAYSAGYTHGVAAPLAYSAGYAHQAAPVAYSAGYAHQAAPLAYSHGVAAPIAYSAGYSHQVAPVAYSSAPAVSYSSISAPVATYAKTIATPVAYSAAPVAYSAPIVAKTISAPVATSYSHSTVTKSVAPVATYAAAPVAAYAKTIAAPLPTLPTPPNCSNLHQPDRRQDHRLSPRLLCLLRPSSCQDRSCLLLLPIHRLRHQLRVVIKYQKT